MVGFFAYDSMFTGGVFVACADLDNDGRAEIITGAGPGGEPHVRAFRVISNVSVEEVASFLAYASTFGGGVFVGAGDVNGDGRAEIITGAGPGGGPRVWVWKVDGTTVTRMVGFFAYDSMFTGGVRVAAADLDGDGRAEVITGAGPGGGPQVASFSVVGGVVMTQELSFFAYDPSFTGGVFVAGFGR